MHIYVLEEGVSTTFVLFDKVLSHYLRKSAKRTIEFNHKGNFLIVYIFKYFRFYFKNQ